MYRDQVNLSNDFMTNIRDNGNFLTQVAKSVESHYDLTIFTEILNNIYNWSQRVICWLIIWLIS